MSRALGRYELLRPIARGGMAEVYLARRRAAGVEKWLVVKRMRPETTGDPRFLDLFVREARLSMGLVHQNIVPVFDFGKIDDQVFLAMERVEGKDLGSSLARAATHRLPPLVAAFIAAECCQALDYAHQRKGPDGVALGIVHRDVTPRNVLLSWSGEVKLTDFGIAALAGDATERLLGTPQYMAPEQARGEPIDPRADVYAIGLVMREAVSGVRPRPGGDRDTILGAARRGELVPWSHLTAPMPEPGELALGTGDQTAAPAQPPDDGPPAALVAIIDRATAILPADRYPDARAMLEDLDSFIVTHRAAYRADLPAHQLAAWLAAVWEGARDDIEADAAIEANHVLSFLDDGAHDLASTGTVRSLAATVADDDAQASDPGVTGAAIPAAATAAAGPSAPPASPATAGLYARATEPPRRPSEPTRRLAEPPRRPSEPPRRPSQKSSANAVVASGSFHVVPAPDAHGAPASGERRPRRSSLSVGIVAAAVAIGAVVIGSAAFLAGGRARDREQARSEQLWTSGPEAGPSSLAPASGPPELTPPVGEPSRPEPVDPGPVDPGPVDPRQPAVVQRPDRPSTGHPTLAPALPVQPPAGRHPVRPPAGQLVPGAEQPPAPPGDSAAPADHPRQATCRVRINLTPWAFYTVDDGATRYETPSTIELAPGPHRLHVWNPELHIERDIVIHVPTDRDTMNYSEPLQPPTLPPAAR